jgi:hypothetical protein
MIIDYNKDRGSFILPGVQEDLWEELIYRLGNYTLLEIDYTTDNFTKFDVDYSLHRIEQKKYAKEEFFAVYEYAKKFLGIRKKVNPADWHRENTQYQADLKQENIKYFSDCLKKTLEEGPDATYMMSSWHSKEEIDSDPNLKLGTPIRKNNKGEYWSVETCKKWRERIWYDDRINHLKSELKHWEEA